MDIIPSYDIENLYLYKYNKETIKIILSNLKKYTKFKKICFNNCGLTKLPSLPDTLSELYCSYSNLTELPNLSNSLT